MFTEITRRPVHAAQAGTHDPAWRRGAGIAPHKAAPRFPCSSKAGVTFTWRFPGCPPKFQPVYAQPLVPPFTCPLYLSAGPPLPVPTSCPGGATLTWLTFRYPQAFRSIFPLYFVLCVIPLIKRSIRDTELDAIKDTLPPDSVMQAAILCR